MKKRQKANPKLAFARNLHLPMMGPLEKSKNLGFRWLLDLPWIIPISQGYWQLTKRRAGANPRRWRNARCSHGQHAPYKGLSTSWTRIIWGQKNTCNTAVAKIGLVESSKQNRKAASSQQVKLFFHCFFRCWGGTYFARGVTDSLSYKYQTLWPTTIQEPPRFLADFWTVYTPSLHPWNCLNLLGCKNDSVKVGQQSSCCSGQSNKLFSLGLRSHKACSTQSMCCSTSGNATGNLNS